VQPLLSWKKIITYSKCVFVGLGILHVMGVRRIVIHGLSDSTILFPRYLLTARFSGKNVIEGKVYVLIFSTNFSETFFIL
jgi:hypothetical protein